MLLLSASSLLVSSATADAAICCVCLDGDSAADNPIVLCDGLCSLAYHALCIMDAAQAAKGIPEGDWWCSAACKAAADANAAAAAALAKAQGRDASSASAASFPLPPLPQLSDAALAAHIHSMRAQRQRRLNDQRAADRSARQLRLAQSSSSSAAAAAAASSSGHAVLPAAPDVALSSSKTADDFWAGVSHYFDPARLLHSARLLNATTFDTAARFHPPLGEYYKHRWSSEDDEAAVERPRAMRTYLKAARGTENHDGVEWEHYWTPEQTAAQPNSPARTAALTAAASAAPRTGDSTSASVAAASLSDVSLPAASAASSASPAGFAASHHSVRASADPEQLTRLALAADAAPEESKSSSASPAAASSVPDNSSCPECSEALNRHRECANARCTSNPYFVPEFVFNRSDKTMRCTAHPCSWEGEPTGPDGAFECPNARCMSVSAQAKRAREAAQMQQQEEEDSSRGDSTPPARSHRRAFFSGASSSSPRKRSHLHLTRVAQAPIRASLQMALIARDAALEGDATAAEEGEAMNGGKRAPSSGSGKNKLQQASPSRSVSSELGAASSAAAAAPAANASSTSSAAPSPPASVDTFVTQFYLNCRRSHTHPSEFPPGMSRYMDAVDEAIAALHDPPEAPPLIKEYIARAYEIYRREVAEGEQRAAAAAFSSLPRASAAVPTPTVNGTAAATGQQLRPLQHINSNRQSSGSRQVAAAARVLSHDTSPRAPQSTAPAAAVTPSSMPASAPVAPPPTAVPPREVVIVDDDDRDSGAQNTSSNSTSARVSFAVIPSAVASSKDDSTSRTGAGAGKGELPAADPSVSCSLHPPSSLPSAQHPSPSFPVADPSPDVELPPLVAPPPPYFILRALDLHYAAESNALPPQTDPLSLPAAYKYSNAQLRSHLMSSKPGTGDPAEDPVFAAIKGPFAGHYTFPQLYETAHGGCLGDADPVDLLADLAGLDPARLEMDLRAERKLKVQAHDTFALNIRSGAVESADQYALVDGDEVSTELWLLRRELLSQVHVNHQRRMELRAAAVAVHGFDKEAYAARVAQEFEHKRVLAEYHAKFPSVYAPACELEQDVAAAAVLHKQKRATTAGKSNSTALRSQAPAKAESRKMMTPEEREAHAERQRAARCVRQNEMRRSKREAQRKMQERSNKPEEQHSSDDSDRAPPASERRQSKRAPPAAASATPSLGLRIQVKEEGEMSDDGEDSDNDDTGDDSDDDRNDSVRVTGTLYPRQAAASSPSRIVHGVSRSGRITQRLLLPQSAHTARRRSGGEDDASSMHDDAATPGVLDQLSLDSLRKQQSANRAQRQRRQEHETSRVMAKRKANSTKQQQKQNKKQQASIAAIAKAKTLPPLPEFDSSELACIQARRASESSTRIKLKLCILKPLLPESTQQSLRDVKSARTPRSHTRRRVVSSSSDSSSEEDDVVLSPGCVVCGGMENPSQVLLCDDCDSEVHLYCNRPPLKNVPRGKFFCPACKEKKAAEASAAAADAAAAAPAVSTEISPDPSSSALASPSSADLPASRVSSRPQRSRPSADDAGASVSLSKIRFSSAAAETIVLSPTSLARIEAVHASRPAAAGANGGSEPPPLKFKLRISKPLLPEATRQALAESKSARSARSPRPIRAAASRLLSSSDDDDVILSPGCVVCGGMENPSEVLLCDDCDSEVHLYCNQPPLKAVPKGKFFCPICKARKAEAAAAQAGAAAGAAATSSATATAAAPAPLPSRVSSRPRKPSLPASASADPPAYLTAELVEGFVLSPGTLTRYFERNVKSPEWPTNDAFDAVLGLEQLLTSEAKPGTGGAAAIGEVRTKCKYVRKVHLSTAADAGAAAAVPVSLTPAKRSKTDGSDSSMSSRSLHSAPPAVQAPMDDASAPAAALAPASAAAASASASVPAAKRIRLHGSPPESLRPSSRRSCTISASAEPVAATVPASAVPAAVSRKRGRPSKAAAAAAAASSTAAASSNSLPFVATCPPSFFAGEEGEEEQAADPDDLLPLSSLVSLPRVVPVESARAVSAPVAPLPGLLDAKAIAAAAAAASAFLADSSAPAPASNGSATASSAEEMVDERKEESDGSVAAAAELDQPTEAVATRAVSEDGGAPCKRARVHNDLRSAAAAAAAAAAASAAAVASFEAAFSTAATSTAASAPAIAVASSSPSSGVLVSPTAARPSRAAANAAAHRLQFASLSESTRQKLQKKL